MAFKLQQKAKGQRPSYFEDPAVDRLLSITLAMAGELGVLRDRVDTVERLLAAGQTVTPEAVDAYMPTEEVRAARDAWRETYLSVVLKAIHDDRALLEAEWAQQQAYNEAVQFVETS